MTSGSARPSASPPPPRLGRRRRFLGLRHDHVHEHRVGIGERRPLRVQRDVLQPDALMQHQLGDVHFEAFGNVAGQTLDFDLALDEFEDAALLLDALRPRP
jgi:hypothetical protein